MASYLSDLDKENHKNRLGKDKVKKDVGKEKEKKRVPLVSLQTNGNQVRQVSQTTALDYSTKPKDVSLENKVESLSVNEEKVVKKVGKGKVEPNTCDCTECANKTVRSSPKGLASKQEHWHEFSAYIDDIHKYLLRIEVKHRAKPYYMKLQSDISYGMRAILIDWLVDVGEEYKLRAETLFLAVSYIDQFLSHMAVVRGKLQLLGTTAMYIAAKHEEIYPPQAGDFAYVTDSFYSQSQVLQMEQIVLKVLDYNVNRPTVHSFLTLISFRAGLSEVVTLLALYIAELTLLEGDPFLEFNPSVLAAGAIAVARHCLHEPPWSSTLILITRLRLKDLFPVIIHLNATHAKSFSNELTSMKNKYSHPKFKCVSDIPARALIIR